MPPTPAWVLPKKFEVLAYGKVVLALGVVNVGQALANRWLIWGQSFCSIQFCQGFSKVFLLPKQGAQAAARLPKPWVQLQRLSEEPDRLFFRSLITGHQTHFVITVGVPRISAQRFLKRIHGCFELFAYVLPETKHPIGFRILKIHA